MIQSELDINNHNYCYFSSVWYLIAFSTLKCCEKAALPALIIVKVGLLSKMFMALDYLLNVNL